MIRIIEFVFVIMLGVVSLIFINNTIRLAIYARRKEIGIMRLVGASNWFIRTPFLLEGVIQALIGAITCNTDRRWPSGADHSQAQRRSALHGGVPVQGAQPLR